MINPLHNHVCFSTRLIWPCFHQLHKQSLLSLNICINRLSILSGYICLPVQVSVQEEYFTICLQLFYWLNVISFSLILVYHLSLSLTKPTKWSVPPTKTHLYPVWSEPSLLASWVTKDPNLLQADVEDWSDWANAQAYLSTGHCDDFVILQLMRKTWICHTRTTKVQISLCIYADWSVPLLFTA